MTTPLSIQKETAMNSEVVEANLRQIAENWSERTETGRLARQALASLTEGAAQEPIDWDEAALHSPPGHPAGEAALAKRGLSPHTPEDAGTGELLPCPHCGGSAAHRPNGNDYAEAGCKACGASMQMGLINRDWRRTKHALVWAWNRRPPLLPDREGVARIVAEAINKCVPPHRRVCASDDPCFAASGQILSLLGGVHAE